MLSRSSSFCSISNSRKFSVCTSMFARLNPVLKFLKFNHPDAGPEVNVFIAQGAVDCDMMELGRMYRRVLHALKLELVNFYLSFQAVRNIILN